MNAKHRKTLAAVFANPMRAGILWSAMRPHPHTTTVIGALKAVRRFLGEAGVTL